MTSREMLASGVVSARVAAALVIVVPRRTSPGVDDRRCVRCRRSRVALAIVALGSPGRPVAGDWIVVDAAGGLLIGVIGLVGLASVLVSPAYLRARDRARPAERASAIYYASPLRLLGGPRSPCRSPATSAPPGC